MASSWPYENGWYTAFHTFLPLYIDCSQCVSNNVKYLSYRFTKICWVVRLIDSNSLALFGHEALTTYL
jgi:hypothetical protein